MRLKQKGVTFVAVQRSSALGVQCKILIKPIHHLANPSDQLSPKSARLPIWNLTFLSSFFESNLLFDE